MTTIYSVLTAFILGTVALFGFGFFYNGMVDTYNINQPEDFTIFNRTGQITERLDVLQEKFNQTSSNPNFQDRIFGVFDLAVVFVGVFTETIFTLPGLIIDTMIETSKALEIYGIPGWLIPAMSLIIVSFFILTIAAILLKRGGGTV